MLEDKIIRVLQDDDNDDDQDTLDDVTRIIPILFGIF